MPHGLVLASMTDEWGTAMMLSATQPMSLRVMTLCLASMATGLADAASKGMSFIGASRAGTNDIRFAADSLAAAGGDVQFAFLPFEFNPAEPFDNVSDLVRSALPRVKGKLRVTVYLKWYPHDAGGMAEQANFWSAWATNSPTIEQQKIRQGFMSRVAKANDWVAEIRAWAARRGLDDQLGITFVPVLEDTCPVSREGAYLRVINAIIAAQSKDRVASKLRRSCLSNNIFRVNGASLELHGTWSQCKNNLQAGDTWSNDGTRYDGTRNEDGSVYSLDQFISAQRDARIRAINVMYWDASYNGAPYEARNWARRTVNPFTSANKNTEKQTLTKVISAR